jgi:hypothetical protein
MDPTEQQIAELFAAFEKDRDIRHIHRALEEVETAQRHTMPEDTQTCKQVLSLSLSFLTRLDSSIDPDWDPKQSPPLRKAPPPPVPGLVVNSSGTVDPAAISDPEIRDRYEKELKAIKDNRQHYNVQRELHLITQRATDNLRLLAENCFTGSSAARKEFEESLATSPLSDARKKSLRKLARKRRWPFS